VARKATGRKVDDRYKPQGRVPYPTLGCGHVYTPGMEVALVVITATKVWERYGHICWVTWDDATKIWLATVDWGGPDQQPKGMTRPQGRLPLMDLVTAADDLVDEPATT